MASVRGLGRRAFVFLPPWCGLLYRLLLCVGVGVGLGGWGTMDDAGKRSLWLGLA